MTRPGAHVSPPLAHSTRAPTAKRRETSNDKSFPCNFGVVRARLDGDRDGLLVFFVCIILLCVAAAVNPFTNLLVAASPVVMLASGITISCPASTLDDLREAVTTLEDAQRTARRVFGGANPLTKGIEHRVQIARAVLRARETPSPGSA